MGGSSQEFQYPWNSNFVIKENVISTKFKATNIYFRPIHTNLYPQKWSDPQYIECYFETIILAEVTGADKSLPLKVTWILNFRLTSLPPALYQCKKLEIIFADSNKIDAIDAAGIQGLPVLGTLDLQNNNVAQVPPELGNCTQIK